MQWDNAQITDFLLKVQKSWPETMPCSVQCTTLWAECQRSYRAYAPQILREKLSALTTACKYTNFYKRDESSQKDKAWRSLKQRENFSLYTWRSFLWLEGQQVASKCWTRAITSEELRNASLNLGSSLQNLFEVYVFKNKKTPCSNVFSLHHRQIQTCLLYYFLNMLKMQQNHLSFLQIWSACELFFLINNVKCNCNHKITLWTEQVN